MLGSICFNSCCDRIGFDQTSWLDMGTCFPENNDFIINISNDISLLSQCKLVFAGNQDVCGPAVRFPESQWQDIKDWIEQGGRMFMAAEHSGNAPDPATHALVKCLKDMERLNSFLGFIGSSIRYIGGDYQGIPFDVSFCGSLTPGPAKIAIDSAPPFMANRFGELQGGTVVWETDCVFEDEAFQDKPSQGVKAVVVAEKLGEGFFFLTGDSDHFFCEQANVCDFMKRLLTTEDNQIL